MFFEDLRDLQDAMPERDLFEDLNLKEDSFKKSTFDDEESKETDRSK